MPDSTRGRSVVDTVEFSQSRSGARPGTRRTPAGRGLVRGPFAEKGSPRPVRARLTGRDADHLGRWRFLVQRRLGIRGLPAPAGPPTPPPPCTLGGATAAPARPPAHLFL